MSRAREAEQQLAANHYGFDGFPESMFVFFFFGLFSEARVTVFSARFSLVPLDSDVKKWTIAEV